MKLSGCLMTAAVVGVMVFSASARADNPANWTTGLITVDTETASASWTSPTPVDTHFSSYNYTYEITALNANVLGQWPSVLDQLDPSDQSGGGNFATLPGTLLSTSINDSTTGVSGDVLITIDSNGYGHLDLSNFAFGGFVSGVQAAATVQVTGVPEPASFTLMGLAGGLLLMRRRKTGQSC